MIVNRYVRLVHCLLCMAILALYTSKSKASAPVLPYAAYIVPVVTSSAWLISVGWGWWTDRKVKRIDANVDVLRADVKKIQETQGEHTKRLATLQGSTDDNARALGADIATLQTITEGGLKKLEEGQEEITQNVDAVRGLMDRNFEKQAKELAVVKTMVDELHKKFIPSLAKSSAAVAPSAKESDELASSSGITGVPTASQPYVHKPLFSTRKTVQSNA